MDNFVQTSFVVFLAQDEPAIIKRKIDLKYKVFGKKRSEDTTMKAGSLTVSAVFQPIESVAKSGEERRVSTSGRGRLPHKRALAFLSRRTRYDW